MEWASKKPKRCHIFFEWPLSGPLPLKKTFDRLVWLQKRFDRDLVSISPTRLCDVVMSADSKSAKRQSNHQCLFALLESACTKAAGKTLVKLTP